jgi:hypothetical protein
MIKSNPFDYPAGWRRRTAVVITFPLGLLLGAIVTCAVFAANGRHEAGKIYPEFFRNIGLAWRHD